MSLVVGQGSILALAHLTGWPPSEFHFNGVLARTRRYDDVCSCVPIFRLVEQAAAYSGAEDEERSANRIAEQERKLAKLIELRDALTRS
jgi:hypothetical protein